MSIYDRKINSNFESVDIAVRDIIDRLQKSEQIADKKMIFKISFMLREILNNAVEHGNKFDVTKSIICKVYRFGNVLNFVVSDEGKGIEIKADILEEDEDVLRARTRGLVLIHEYGFSTYIHGSTIEVKLPVKEETYV